jgi:lipid A 3-O-deacylase
MNSARYRCLSFAGLLAMLLLPSAAEGQEIFGGVYRHDVPLIRGGGHIESGEDFQLGYRFGRILPFLGGPRPHVMVLVNSNGGANFAAGGISWKLGDPFYLRPGIGIAVHDGDVHLTQAFLQRHRIPFGSAVLFAPEISAGVRIGRRVSIEASWLHFSHAGLFSHLNPGIDDIGGRLAVVF